MWFAARDKSQAAAAESLLRAFGQFEDALNLLNTCNQVNDVN